MATTVTAYLDPKTITGRALADLSTNSLGQRAVPGSIYHMVASFGGAKLFMFIRNTSGSAMVTGDMTPYLGGANNARSTSAGTLTAGTTLQATTSGLTAENHQGTIFWVTDDNGGAGAAPEGEGTLVKANTATIIDFDPSYPLSSAVAASDTAELISTWQVRDSIAAVECAFVTGVVVGAAGIDSLSYGYTQIQGVAPCTQITTPGITEADSVICDAKVVKDGGGGAAALVVGTCLASSGADTSNNTCLVDLTIHTNNIATSA